MIQRYDFAPLDGITKVVFRQVYHRMFGGTPTYSNSGAGKLNWLLFYCFCCLYYSYFL